MEEKQKKIKDLSLPFDHNMHLYTSSNILFQLSLFQVDENKSI